MTAQGTPLRAITERDWPPGVDRSNYRPQTPINLTLLSRGIKPRYVDKVGIMMNECGGCKRDFGSVTAFDRHQRWRDGVLTCLDRTPAAGGGLMVRPRTTGIGCDIRQGSEVAQVRKEA